MLSRYPLSVIVFKAIVSKCQKTKIFTGKDNRWMANPNVGVVTQFHPIECVKFGNLKYPMFHLGEQKSGQNQRSTAAYIRFEHPVMRIPLKGHRHIHTSDHIHRSCKI